MSGEFRVGPSLVQPSLNSIIHNGKTARLEPKVMEVLVYLAEHQGQVVSKEQLMRAVWAETFVSDDVLTRCISELRKALEDDAKEPHVIQTIPKKGYRLMPTVLMSAVEQPRKPNRRKVSAYAVLAAALLIVTLAAFGWLARRVRALRRPGLIVRQLTPGGVGDPFISPDGNYLAYCNDDGISLQPIGTGEIRLLSGTKGFCMADWFPDGASLAATRDHELWVVSALTGAMRKIADNIGHAWVSPDGTRIAFFRPEAWVEGNAIWVMDADGENQHILAKAEAGELFESFAWAPNGQRFIDHKYRPNEEFAIETRDLHGAQLAVILSDPRLAASDKDVLWLPDGRIVYALDEPAPREQDNNFWAVQVDSSGRASGRPTQITNFAGDVLTGFSASRDGKRLVFTREDYTNVAIYVGELEANGTRLKQPQRLTINNWVDWPTGWSSDSQSVLFVSSRGGGLRGRGWEVFKQGLNELTAGKLSVGAEEYPWATFSSEGRWLLFWAVTRGKDRFLVRLMRQPASGGTPEVVLTSNQLTASHQCALRRPNFCILEEQDPGRNERVFSAFDPSRGRTGEIKRMTGGFIAPYAWWSLSPDGTRIAVAQRKPTIRILDLKTGTEQNLTAKTEMAVIHKIAWSSDGKSLFTSGWSEEGTGMLVNVDMQGNTHLLQQDSHAWFGFPAPSPDGQHLAFANAKTVESNVAMMENF